MDRARHDASVRHQSQLQSFIRGLHRQNRDADREARLAAAAVKDLEAAVAAESKNATTISSDASIGTSTVVEPTQKLRSRPAFYNNKPIRAASVAAAASDGSPAKVLIFEKKKHAKKVDPDTANWKFEEKTAEVSATSYSTTGASKVALDLLGDDDENDDDKTSATKPKKALFKKRQIRVSK